MTHRYVLGPDGEPRPEPDLHAWAHAFETMDRRVAWDELADGAIQVSTVFLALDHAFGTGPPVLWETLVFVDEGMPANLRVFDGEQRRYRSRADAQAGHAGLVMEIQAALDAQRES